MCLKLTIHLIAENTSMKHKYKKKLVNDKNLKALHVQQLTDKISNQTQLQEKMAAFKKI